MFQVSIVSAVRSALLAAAILAVVTAGLVIRTAAPGDVPTLGAADDYGTRHGAAVQSTLSRADDFWTRHQAAPQLTRADDFGTRHAAKPIELGPANEYGTRLPQ